MARICAGRKSVEQYFPERLSVQNKEYDDFYEVRDLEVKMKVKKKNNKGYHIKNIIFSTIFRGVGKPY